MFCANGSEFTSPIMDLWEYHHFGQSDQVREREPDSQINCYGCRDCPVARLQADCITQRSTDRF
jgi:hypothetical protein